MQLGATEDFSYVRNKLSKRLRRRGAFHCCAFFFRGAIRNLALAITDPAERARAVLWVNKLFGAEYHVEVLRDKRNRYLAALTVSMINDELIGIFAEDPPVCALKDLTKMQILPAPAAEWEKDTTWVDFVSTLPDNCKEVNPLFFFIQSF